MYKVISMSVTGEFRHHLEWIDKHVKLVETGLGLLYLECENKRVLLVSPKIYKKDGRLHILTKNELYVLEKVKDGSEPIGNTRV